MTSKKPRVFIASSSESLDYADAVHQNLERTSAPTVWDQGIFDLSRYALESLEEEAPTFDFAVFIFSPDDVVRIRKREYLTARDNVVFELGLFMGVLSRERCFIVTPRINSGVTMRLPSDLWGLTTAQFEDDPEHLTAALGSVCARIRQAIKRLGRRTHTSGPSVAVEELSSRVEKLESRTVILDQELQLLKSTVSFANVKEIERRGFIRTSRKVPVRPLS